MEATETTEEVERWPGQCPECGDLHDDDGTPDEYGNRYVPELDRCNNCVSWKDGRGVWNSLCDHEQAIGEEITLETVAGQVRDASLMLEAFVSEGDDWKLRHKKFVVRHQLGDVADLLDEIVGDEKEVE